MMHTNQLAIVIISCDAYADAWDPFFKLFDAFWPQCSFQKYFITETLHPKRNDVIVVKTNPNDAWTKRYKEGLKVVNEPYILNFQEDFLLTQPVDEVEILKLFELCIKHTFAAIKLYPAIEKPLLPFDQKIGIIDPLEERYYASLQSSIWNKDLLIQILNSDESIWAFELEGGKRAKELNYTIGCVHPKHHPKLMDEVLYPVTYVYFTAITRGKWLRRAVWFCNRSNVLIDLTKRPRHTLWNDFYFYNAPNWLQHIMDFINQRSIRWFKTDLRFSTKP